MPTDNPRFEVIPSRLWIRDDGRRFSPYGAHPGGTCQLVQVGWTVRDRETGTVGIGRQPWETKEAAEAWVANWTARHTA
jgi:hypothetical protein